MGAWVGAQGLHTGAGGGAGAWVRMWVQARGLGAAQTVGQPHPAGERLGQGPRNPISFAAQVAKVTLRAA